MESEGYLRVGRGGAGNYYSNQDIQEVKERAAKDVEAQPTNDMESRLEEIKPAEYVHSGRGGAGNYETTPSTVERQRSLSATPSVMEHPFSGGSFYGRGGAGNLRNLGADTSAEVEGKASEAQNEAYEKMVKDVESELQQPARAHLVNEKL